LLVQKTKTVVFVGALVVSAIGLASFIHSFILFLGQKITRELGDTFLMRLMSCIDNKAV